MNRFSLFFIVWLALKVTVYEQKKGIGNKEKAKEDLDNFDPLITFRLLSLETECVQRTFDTNLFLSIGGVDLKQRYDGADIDAIGTPMTSGLDQYLFTVRFTQVCLKSNYTKLFCCSSWFCKKRLLFQSFISEF